MITKTEFQPGIISDETDLASASGFIDGDKMRARNGRMQVIGGWEAATGDATTGLVRGAHAWASLEGDRVFAAGTATTLHGYFGGDLSDITPLKASGTLTDPFATVSGSARVTVTHQDHGLRLGDAITFSHADAVGGLTINGEYTLIQVLSIDQYVIEAASNASSTATGGGSVDFVAALDAGLVDGTGGGRGYGTGGWGTGFYSISTVTEFEPRVWSIDNWGGNMLAVPRNGALYEWQPLPIYDVVSSDIEDWATGTGWTITGGEAVATAGDASDLTDDVTGDLVGGVTYELVIDVTVSAGSLQFKVESDDTGDVNIGAAITKTGEYTRIFTSPPSPIALKLSKDATFAGTVASISVRVVPVAYRIQAAPQYAAGMFVDPNRIVVLYNTLEADGDFNPMLVRWSDQENNRVWIPDLDNLAGEFVLGRGSRVIGGMPARDENLIWTDAALYAMRFTGDSGGVFRFDLIGENCGLIGKQAMAIAGGRVFWWGRDNQFYAYSGGEPEIIPCGVRREIEGNLAPAQEEKIVAGVVSEFSEIWWFYPDSRDGNECSRYICFNYAEGVWTKGTLGRTSWLPAGVYAFPVGFGTDNRIYFQERGRTDNGATLDWSLKTGLFDIKEGETVFAVRRYIPDFADQIGNVEVSFTFSQWQRGPQVDAGTYTITPITRDIPLRHMGRQAQITFAAGANSQFVRFGVQRFDVVPTGARR